MEFVETTWVGVLAVTCGVYISIPGRQLTQPGCPQFLTAVVCLFVPLLIQASYFVFVHPVFRLHKVEVALLCELEFKHQVLLLSQLLLLLLLFFWGVFVVGFLVCLFICLSKYRHQHDLFLRFTMYVVIVLSWVWGGGDSSVVRAPDSWLKGRGFESLLERRENFLLQGRLSVLTLISVSVPPPCYHSST